jgi:hypothetical protein
MIQQNPQKHLLTVIACLTDKDVYFLQALKQETTNVTEAFFIMGSGMGSLTKPSMNPKMAQP